MSNIYNFQRIKDNLINFVTGLGTVKDPTTSSSFILNLLDRNTLENAYRSDWVARKIVDAPAEDITREWRAWQASQDQIEKIEELEEQLDIQEKLKLAIVRARLYGGAALVIGVEQGETWEPIDYDKVGKGDLKFVVVLNRYELSAGPRIYNVNSPWYTRPEYYVVQTPMFGFSFEEGGTYPGSTFTGNSLVVPQYPQGQAPSKGDGDYNKQVTPARGMVQIHPSRVIELSGNPLPDWRLAPMGGGWGDSVLQTVEETLKDFGVTVGGIAAMVNDAKLDVIKIPDFSKNIATKEYAAKLLQRFTLANTAKSSVNSILLDTEEEWERISTAFSGLPQIMTEFMTIVAGAGGIPVSRLMGNAPSKGLSGKKTGGGETDIRNYYDDCASKQKTVYKPALKPLDECLIRSALGSRDKNIWYEWNPLYREDPAELAEIAKNKSDVVTADVQMGLINEDVIRQARINQLIEDGTYPGFEDAVAEFGAKPKSPVARQWSPGYDPNTGKPLQAPGGGAGGPGGAFGKPGGSNGNGGPPKPNGGTAPGQNKPQSLKMPAMHFHIGGQPPTKDALIVDFDPNEARDPHGMWTAGNYGLVAGDVEKFHDLKNQWAKINNQLLNSIDTPEAPETQNAMHQLEDVVQQMHSLHADSGMPKETGLPGGPRDVTIIGAGPGGLAASIFGGAEGLDTLVVESNAVAGGQARYSSRIENFPGFPVGVKGERLTKDMFDQAERLGAEAKLGVRVVDLDYDPKSGLKRLTLSNGEKIDTRSVILAGGLEFRRPNFQGAEGPGVIVGDGKTLTEQSSGGDAIVVGGSNGAAQAALGAATKASHVYLLSRSAITKGMSDYQVEAVHNNPKITVVENDSIAKLNRDAKGNPESIETVKGQKIPSKAIGVFLGSVPETKWLGGKINVDETGRISTDQKLETNIPGVYAVGDMRKGAIGRIGVAVGEGQLALREANVYLDNMKKQKTTTDGFSILDASTSNLIHQLFAIDRENPYFGQTLEGVKPVRHRQTSKDTGFADFNPNHDPAGKFATIGGGAIKSAKEFLHNISGSIDFEHIVRAAIGSVHEAATEAAIHSATNAVVGTLEYAIPIAIGSAFGHAIIAGAIGYGIHAAAEKYHITPELIHKALTACCHSIIAHEHRAIEFQSLHSIPAYEHQDAAPNENIMKALIAIEKVLTTMSTGQLLLAAKAPK